MTLASMIGFDENALICDFAEVYNIYDYRSLPVRLAATLAAGLREDSRIRMKLRGEKINYRESLLAMTYDILLMRFSKNEIKEEQTMLYLLNSEGKQPKLKENGSRTFGSAEEARERRQQIIGGVAADVD